MDTNLSPDLQSLHDQLDAAERDAHALVAGLTQEQGIWQPQVGSWSIAECLDHIATGNHVYLAAMQEPAARARARGQFRSRPVKPGLIGHLFARSFEPPPAWWSRRKAPRKIRPRAESSLAEAFADLVASQGDFRAFLFAQADLDLTSIRFPNPFVRGIRFSIATGLYVITAHQRRHLWQAWQVRRRLERAG
jgi:DinB superfamily